MFKNNTLLWRSIATILGILFITIPGSKLTWFNGLPLTPLETLLAFAFFIFIWSTHWHTHKTKRTLLIGASIALIVWQIVGYATIPYGWSVCLQRTVEQDTLTTPCEPSAEFRFGEQSFIYEKIDFAKNKTPLYFINDNVFDYPDSGDLDRHSIPYTFTATTFFPPAKESQEIIATSNTIDTVLRINNTDYPVPFDEETKVTLPRNKLNKVTISYTTPHNDSNAIQIKDNITPYYKAPISVFTWPIFTVSYQIISLLLYAVLAIMVLIEIMRLYIEASTKTRAYAWYGIALTIMIASWKSAETGVFALGILGLAAISINTKSKRSKILIPLVILLLFIQSMTFVSAKTTYDTVTILEGRNDPFTHESHARATLTAKNIYSYLEAGRPDSVFYFQPFYRYALGIIHKILGESLWGIYVVQTFLLAIAIIYGTRFVHTIGGAFPASIFGFFAFTAMIMPEHNPAFLAKTTYQEALGLPILLIALIATLSSYHNNHNRRLINIFGIGLLWGISMMIRTDYLPALLGLGVYSIFNILQQSSIKKRIFCILPLILGFSIIPTFILIRNLIIAGKFTILTQSGYINLLPPFQTLFSEFPESDPAGLGTIMYTIWSNYYYRLGELIPILWNNVYTHIEDPLIITSWIATCIFATYILIRKTNKERAILLIVLLTMITPIIIGSLFIQDNPLAYTSYYSCAILFAFTITLALLFSTPQLKIKSHSHTKVRNDLANK